MWSDLRRWSERHPRKSRTEMRTVRPHPLSVADHARRLLSATVVAVSVSLMAAAAYFVVYRAVYSEVDRQLESRADGMTALSRTGALRGDPQRVVSGAVFSTNISVALIRPDGQTFLVGSVPFRGA